MDLQALRVEWAKAGARGDRFEEEVVTLDGEMGRVLKYCGYKYDWWKAQIPRRLPNLQEPHHKVLREGLAAYAEQQAHMERTIALNWGDKWRAVRDRAVDIIQGNTPFELLEEEGVGLGVGETTETIELFDDDDEPMYY